MEATVEQLAKTPGVLEIGERRFVILPPTPRDMLAIGQRMKELARAKCVSPLDYVLKHTSLTPTMLAVAVNEAIKLGSGGGVDPSPDAVWEQYSSLEGVRFQVWHYAKKAHGTLLLEEVEKLVTEDNLFDVGESLDKALRFGGLDPKKATPEAPTGAS